MTSPIKIVSAEEVQRRRVQAVLETLERQKSPQARDIFISQLANSTAERWLAAFITDDAAMNEVKAQVRRLINLPDPVLITGPSGTGKELLAHALHGSKDPLKFHPFNCAACPEELAESILFGHRKGAFTGAVADHNGLFEDADDGTVFLDEIGEAPLALQAKLLRALQPDINGKRWVLPVGSNVHREVRCRIIAATKRDLFAQVQAKEFREDLYGRLMTFELVISSITDRPADKLPILKSLGCEDLSEIDSPYWRQRIELFNVRALQAYAKRASHNLL